MELGLHYFRYGPVCSASVFVVIVSSSIVRLGQDF